MPRKRANGAVDSADNAGGVPGLAGGGFTAIELIGGLAALDRGARELFGMDIVMASHIADWAWFGDPDDPDA